MESNDRVGIEFAQPRTYDSRANIAAQCCTALELDMPLVVDAIDNRVEKAYGAFPDRLFIVDAAGKVAFKGGRGPFGFEPRELEKSLAMLLLDQPPPAAPAQDRPAKDAPAKEPPPETSDVDEADVESRE